MAKINLLPWRAERRARRQRDFYSMLGLAAAAGLVLSFLIWFYYSQQISGQNTRNQFLQGEITKVEAKIKEIEELDRKRASLLQRKQAIEQLQASRSQMVHLFDSLVRTIPDGVALSNIKQEGEILTLEGRAQSNARVSAYMRNLESSGWMTNPELSVIEAKAQEASGSAVDIKSLPYVFTLKVKLPAPGENAAQTAEADAAPAAAPAPAAAATPAAAAPAADTAQKEARP